jgi:hypothetical protein
LQLIAETARGGGGGSTAQKQHDVADFFGMMCHPFRPSHLFGCAGCTGCTNLFLGAFF